MNGDDKFQTLMRRMETNLAAENVQWAKYTTSAKKKQTVPARHRFSPRTQKKA